MIQYKNGLFCETCGSYVEMPISEDFIHCLRCKKVTSLLDLNLDYFKEEKVYSKNKDWIQDYYSNIPSDHQKKVDEEPTIEQQCINKNCDSNLCYYTSRQMRSADEGETIFYQCVKCRTRFSLNN